MQRKQQEIQAKKTSPSNDPKTDNQNNTNNFEINRYQFSSNLVYILKKLMKYDSRSFINISSSELKQGCEIEIKRIQQLKSKDKNIKNKHIDNELSVVVMNNHIRAIADLKKENDQNMQKYGSSNTKRPSNDNEETKQNLIIRRYESITSEIDKNEQQIRQYMNNKVINNDQIDFAECYNFFVTQTKKMKKQGQQKLILSRVYLMQTLNFFLGEALRKWQPDRCEEPVSDGDISQNSIINRASNEIIQQSQVKSQGVRQNLTYEQINKWSRYSSKFLQDKMIELSGICQQIPQLQIFNRTLQFSQLQNRQRVSFFRIVDVLISLHHKVSYLSRNKPTLLKELQYAQQEILYINECCQKFISQIDNEMPQIFVLNFTGFDQRKKSQLSEAFNDLKHFLTKLSQIIISQDLFHTENYDKIDRLINLVTLYSKVIAGENQFVEQWQELIQTLQQQKQGHTVTNDEYKLIMILDQCMQLERTKINAAISHGGDHIQTTKTNQELEDEVNKLIEDYERLKMENGELVNNVEIMSRVRDQFLIQVEERDSMIKNLSAVIIQLQKKVANQEGASIKSSKNMEEEFRKIEHQVQKYKENSLHLNQQLKILEREKEKLLEIAQTEKGKYLKIYEIVSRIKPEKERNQIELEEMREKIQNLKNDHLRQVNRYNKQINDLTNDKSFLQMQLQTAERNNLKMMQRLESAERKSQQYNKSFRERIQQESKNSIYKIQKDCQKYKKTLETTKQELAILQKDYFDLKDQNTNLKIKIKQMRISCEKQMEKQELINELKNKNQKLTAKIVNLNKENDDLHHREDQLQSKYKIITKRIKQLQGNQRDYENERKMMMHDLQERERRLNDFIKQIQEVRNKSQRQGRNSRDIVNRRDLQINDKNTRIQMLEIKNKDLQQQLNKKRQQTESTINQLTEVKIKQFETTIQTHKLIEIRMEEQTKILKKELQEKIQIQFKLNFQIDKLKKEIDRLQELLEKYLRDLTEKQFILKTERQKTEEQIKIIRNYEIQEKCREQSSNIYDKQREDNPHTSMSDNIKRNTNHSQIGFTTPSLDKNFEQSKKKEFESSTIKFDEGQIIKKLGVNKEIQVNIVNDNSISKSTGKYDNYFNVKEYERLANEYAEFKITASHQIEQLQRIIKEIKNENQKINQQHKQDENNVDKMSNQQEARIINKLQQENIGLIVELQKLTKQNQQIKKIGEKSKRTNDLLVKQMNQQFKKMKDQKKRIEDNELTLISQLQNKKKQLQLEHTTCNQIKQQITKMQKTAKDTTEEHQRNLRLLNINIDQLKEQLQNKNQQLNIKIIQIKQKDQSLKSISESLTNKHQQLSLLNQKLKLNDNQIKIKPIFDQNQHAKIIQQKDLFIEQLRQNNSQLQTDISQLHQILQKIDSQNLLLHTDNTNLFADNNYLRTQLNIVVLKLAELQSKDMQNLSVQLNIAIEEKDMFRMQYDQARLHLQQATQKAMFLEGQRLKIQTELNNKIKEYDNEKQKREELNLLSQNQILIIRQLEQDQIDQMTKYHSHQYCQLKIKSLEEALEAVGDQFSDSKSALQKKTENQRNQELGCINIKNQIIIENNEQRTKTQNLPQQMIQIQYQRLFVQNQKMRSEMQNLIFAQQQFFNKEKIYLNQMESLSREVINLKETIYSIKLNQKPKVTTLPIDARPSSSTYSDNGIEEELKRRGFLSKQSSSNLLIQIDKIIQLSRRWENSRIYESLQRWNLPSTLSQQLEDIRINLLKLCDCTNILRQQYIKVYNIILMNPSLGNIIEYVVRILTHFSQIPLDSPQASKIHNQLQKMSQSYAGGLYFTILEQYTIHVLQNNTIEEYKRQLRAKAKELLDIKQKLDEVITRQIQQQQKMYNRAPPARRRQPSGTVFTNNHQRTQ